jgi:hypothetical protein
MLVTMTMLLTAAQGRCQSNQRDKGAAVAEQPGSAPATGSSRRLATAEQVAARPPLVLAVPAASAPVTASAADQKTVMRKSARAAWSFVSRSMSSAGFAPATDAYDYTTVWDMASTLASIYSARELGFVTPAQYKRSIDRALATLEKMPLYDNGGFNKLYDSRNGAMVDRKTVRSGTGFGWSVLDHGRMLVWLRLVGDSDPAFAARAQAIVARLDMKRLVRDGYLRGEDLDPDDGKVREYQEGRIGYEQYAAEGFALWGVRAPLALDFAANGKPVTVNGQTLLADTRGSDLLTSEPFVMMGLELGWPGAHWKPLSLALLAAQEERFKQTGIVTMVSEDAVPDPPAYFYYYLAYRDGESFVVRAPGSAANPSFPRWVSAKAAFGYHALAPSSYTWRAVQTVQWGSTPERGWTAGVYEGTHNSTKAFNLNTAALVLESAAYIQRGCPFVQRTCEAKPAN